MTPTIPGAVTTHCPLKRKAFYYHPHQIGMQQGDARWYRATARGREGQGKQSERW
jgi:uncharacterized protein (DUF427 family)